MFRLVSFPHSCAHVMASCDLRPARLAAWRFAFGVCAPAAPFSRQQFQNWLFSGSFQAAPAFSHRTPHRLRAVFLFFRLLSAGPEEAAKAKTLQAFFFYKAKPPLFTGCPEKCRGFLFCKQLLAPGLHIAAKQSEQQNQNGGAHADGDPDKAAARPVFTVGVRLGAKAPHHQHNQVQHRHDADEVHQ